MKKMRATILSILASTAFAIAGTALVHAQNDAPIKPIEVLAEESQSITAALLSPDFYAEYLPLESPVSVSVTEAYTLIADKNKLYLFDKAENQYYSYTHKNDITKAEIDENGRLYFLSALRSYEISADAFKAGTPANYLDVVCSRFTLGNGDLYYYYDSQTILSTSEQTLTLSYPLQNNAPLAFHKDLLYCVCKNEAAYVVYAINPQTNNEDPIASFSEEIKSLAVTNNLLCVITETDDFYAYSYAEINGNNADSVTPITKEESGYTSLCTYGDDVYAIRGSVVRQYLGESMAFTNSEIGNRSAAPQRFYHASDLFLSDNKLFIADVGNERISVYDTDSQEFLSSIPCTLQNPKLASYHNTLLASSETETVLYSLHEKQYGAELFRLNETQGRIIGIANVYDRYYILTDKNYCYMLLNEDGQWISEETQKSALVLRPKAFTADVYGSLYVAYDNEKVYRYTEQELLTSGASGTKILDGLQNTEKLALDYESNLYSLSNGILTKYTADADGNYAQSTEYIPDYGLVYDETPCVSSFAFGVNSPLAYFLYRNNYLVQSDELNVPIVCPIPVGNAKESLFGENTAPLSVVKIPANAIMIEFDANALKESETFPYVSFARSQTELTALKMSEENEYAIVSALKSQTGKHTTYLVLNESCITLDKAEYYQDYTNSPKIGYLTGDIALYKYPYMTNLLTLESLSRAEEVKVIGEVITLDYAYYKVTVESESGTKTGYIPKPFITLFDGSHAEMNTTVIGDTATDHDSVWRFVYLILGFGAICILTDFLILRKSKKDD